HTDMKGGLQTFAAPCTKDGSAGQSDILTDIAEWQIYERSLASPAALLQANEKCARAAQNVAIYPRLAVHNPRRRTTHVKPLP
ncbi:MAG: hypothetical protein ACI9VX_000698, partial [Dinoroseobacter sp.]